MSLQPVQVVLPHLQWEPSAASSSRGRHPVELVVVHRWGDRYPVPATTEAEFYRGTINYLKDPAHHASAHVVFPGSAAPGEATQLVAWADMAWAEAAYNPVADEIECADAIWLGHDEPGLRVLARIVAYRCHARGIPAVWSTRHGVCRHADLGAAGGDHLECPTTDLALWRHFIRLVQYNLPWNGREHWGR